MSRGGPSWDLHPRDFHPNNVAWFRVCCPAPGQGDAGTQGHRDAGTRAVPAAAGRRGTAPVQPHAGHEQHCSPAAPRPRPGPRTQPLAAASLCAKPGPGKWGWGHGDVGTPWGHGDAVPVLPLLAPHSPAQGSAQAGGMQHAFSSARFARQRNCRFRSARIARRPKIIGGKNAKKKKKSTYSFSVVPRSQTMPSVAAPNSFIFLIRRSVFFSLRGEGLKCVQAGSARPPLISRRG